jgi:pyruvate,water dikinase
MTWDAAANRWIKSGERFAGSLSGRTSHTAIVSRELGIPAIVGTGEGTDVLRPGQEVTHSCAEGDQGLYL